MSFLSLGLTCSQPWRVGALVGRVVGLAVGLAVVGFAVGVAVGAGDLQPEVLMGRLALHRLENQCTVAGLPLQAFACFLSVPHSATWMVPFFKQEAFSMWFDAPFAVMPRTHLPARRLWHSVGWAEQPFSCIMTLRQPLLPFLHEVYELTCVVGDADGAAHSAAMQAREWSTQYAMTP